MEAVVRKVKVIGIHSPASSRVEEEDAYSVQPTHSVPPVSELRPRIKDDNDNGV